MKKLKEKLEEEGVQMKLGIKITSKNKILLNKRVYMIGGDSLEIKDEGDMKILIVVKESLWNEFIDKIQQLFRGRET